MGFTIKQSVNLSKLADRIDRKNEKAIMEAAIEVKRAQQRTLVARVRNFSGILFNSIDIVKRGKNKIAIGPDLSMAPYAEWIEDGSPDQKGGFIGYFFVRNSTRAVQQKFNNLILRSIERP